MSQPNNQRKIHYIQPEFQGRFIAWAIFGVLLAGAVSAALVYLLLTNGFESQARSAHLTVEAIWNQLGISVVVGNIVAGLVGAIAMALIVLYRSHKIAGPMYRMQALFKEVGRGNLEVSTRLRDQDQLQELAEAFGDMLENLRESRRKRQDALHEVHELVDQLQRHIGESPSCTPTLKALRERLAILTVE